MFTIKKSTNTYGSTASFKVHNALSGYRVTTSSAAGLVLAGLLFDYMNFAEAEISKYVEMENSILYSNRTVSYRFQLTSHHHRLHIAPTGK